MTPLLFQKPPPRPLPTQHEDDYVDGDDEAHHGYEMPNEAEQDVPLSPTAPVRPKYPTQPAPISPGRWDGWE